MFGDSSAQCWATALKRNSAPLLGGHNHRLPLTFSASSGGLVSPERPNVEGKHQLKYQFQGSTAQSLGTEGQKKRKKMETARQQSKGRDGTQVGLYHLEVLFLSRGRDAFPKVQELL